MKLKAIEGLLEHCGITGATSKEGIKTLNTIRRKISTLKAVEYRKLLSSQNKFGQFLRLGGAIAPCLKQ